MELWSAFLLGLFGSLHCVVMCGPIALSLPISKKDKLFILLDILIYNSGRIATYSFIGLIVGFFGRFVFFSGYQQYFSIAIGSIIILSIFLINFESKFNQTLGINKFQNWITQQFGKFINSNKKSSLFLVGILNGFLPCGLVYIAVAGAFTNFDIATAVKYMFVFGLGTLPLMLALSIFRQTIRNKVNVKKFYPVLIAGIGLLFILRGLNLGIPYMSPKIDKPNGEQLEINCN